jgi:hypothetical protein
LISPVIRLKIFVMCLLLSEAGFGGNFFERLDRRVSLRGRHFFELM